MIVSYLVIPAQAGIQLLRRQNELDPRLRGDDEEGNAS
jgi:hypothetical protein